MDFECIETWLALPEFRVTGQVMRSYVGELENARLLLLSSFNLFSTEGARRWPPQQRPTSIRRPPSPQPFWLFAIIWAEPKCSVSELVS